MTILREIVRRIGGELYAGGNAATVPGPGHSKSDRSLSLTLVGDRVVWHSFANDPVKACAAHLGIAATPESELSKNERTKLRRERRLWEITERHRKQQFCIDLWTRAISATGSPAHAYLRGRAIAATTLPPSLRYLAATPRGYRRRDTSPAMLALVCDRYGAATGLHVTFLPTADQPVPHRIMLGTIQGGAVRLYAAGGHLAICEGIETALSYAALTGTPTWAILSTAGLSNFVPPIETNLLTLAIDSDDLSVAHPRGAALEIAQSLSFPWCETFIDPAPADLDWNDVLRSQQ